MLESGQLARALDTVESHQLTMIVEANEAQSLMSLDSAAVAGASVGRDADGGVTNGSAGGVWSGGGGGGSAGGMSSHASAPEQCLRLWEELFQGYCDLSEPGSSRCHLCLK